MSMKGIRMVQVPKGAWSLVIAKGKGLKIKIGPFEEWIPRAMAEWDEADGCLYVHHGYFKEGNLWTSILRNYPVVWRHPRKERDLDEE